MKIEKEMELIETPEETAIDYDLLTFKNYKVFEYQVKRIIRKELLAQDGKDVIDLKSMIARLSLEGEAEIKQSIDEMLDSKIVLKLEPIKTKVNSLILTNFKIIIASTTIIAITLAVLQIFIFFMPTIRRVLALSLVS